MKYLLAQPANIRFSWELDVFLTNLRSLDKNTPVVLLFLREQSSVVQHFVDRYPNLEIHEYADKRERKNYIPTIRPYLVCNYLKENPSREKEDYFQLDSDIIFRKLPDFSKMPLNSQICYASDCEGYMGYHYLMTRKNGPKIVDKFSEILFIPRDIFNSIPGVGAQWLIYKPTAQLYWHIWQDSQILYDFLKPIDSDIQKWTAEMFAQLYNLVKFGWYTIPSDELTFCRPTDNVLQYYKYKILHNAGVTAELSDKLFFKGKYTTHTPFSENLSWVDKTKASIKYVEAIQKVALHNRS